MLKKLRITLATIFFVGITLMFLDFTGTLHHWLGWMAKVQFLPAVLALNVVIILVLLVLTLVFGRIYCSVICPLGIFQDLVARLRRKKNKYSYSKAISWLRYTMLGIMVVALVAGIGSVVQLLAPYSAYGRIATMIFQPIWKFGNNLLASVAERIDSYAFYRTEVLVPAMGVVLIVAVATALLVGILAWRNGRTYCNTICPVGTVLSFFARFSWFKIRFDEDKCRNCSLCSKNCKAACIDFKTRTVDYSRCVVCGNCIDKCKFGALSYVGGYKSTKASAKADNNSYNAGKVANTDSSVDAGKRSFLLSAALATTAAMAQDKKKVDGGLAVIEDKVAPERQTPITPPGSVSARNMAQHCTACQLCVSECPNQVLRPSNSLSSFMQPVMSYELGYCRPECTRCSDVCPTGAIHHIAKEQKSSTQIGHAVWIKKNCIPLTDGVECGNCARHCPVGAIEMVPSNPDDEESAYVPAVNESRCIGCGACENLCPARPFSAIYVEGHEVHKEV
jgi:ferredoxin